MRTASSTSARLTRQPLSQAVAGRLIFALAMLCFGMQYLALAVGAGVPAPGDPWFPGPAWLSAAAGIGLLAAAVGLIGRAAARWTALALGVALSLRVLAVHLPQMLVKLRNPGPWTSATEMLAMSAGAFAIAANGGAPRKVATAARWMLAAALFVFGIQHFLYGPYVASLVPAWIPWRLFVGYFVGAAFVAAGLAILLRRFGRLACALLGTMFLLFVVLLHIPLCVAAPRDGNLLTSALIAFAMAGCGFAMAGPASRASES